MAKDKLFEARMQGAMWALKIAEEQGVEELQKEVKLRGYYEVPFTYTTKQIDDFVETIGHGSKEAIFALIYTVLHEDFGFGEKRLMDFAKGFQRRFRDVFTLDYMGEHYVTLTDFAVMMKKKYGSLSIDIERIELEQNAFDEHDVKVGNRKFINGIINTLRNHGFEDAAQFFEQKMDNLK